MAGVEPSWFRHVWKMYLRSRRLCCFNYAIISSAHNFKEDVHASVRAAHSHRLDEVDPALLMAAWHCTVLEMIPCF
jgi:hypothetical protein